MRAGNGAGPLAAVLAHSASIHVVTYLVRPASAYQALSLDVPVWALGAIAATFAIVPLVIAVPVGSLTDRFGEKKLMIVGSLTMAMSTGIFLLFAGSIWGLLVGNALAGAGHLMCVVAQQTFVANRYAATRLDSMFGFLTFFASLGQAIGPAIVAILGGSDIQPDTRGMFVVAAAVAGFMFVVVLFVKGGHSPHPHGAAGAVGGTFALLKQAGVVRALTTSAVVLAAIDITFIYLPALGAERGLTAATIGTLLAVRAICSMASRLVLGPLSRILGRQRLLIGSLALAAAAMAVTAAPLPLPLLIVAIALLGFGLGVGQPITMSWLTERTPAGQRARALSLRLAGNRVGQVVIPTAMGAAAAALGVAAVLVATGVAIGATIFLIHGGDFTQPLAEGTPEEPAQ